MRRVKQKRRRRRRPKATSSFVEWFGLFRDRRLQVSSSLCRERRNKRDTVYIKKKDGSKFRVLNT